MMNENESKRECPKCGAPVPPEAPQGLCPKCVLAGAAADAADAISATATSEIPSLERVARAFPQLEILELIGRGGMGFVFKARQPHLDRFVALKLLPDKLAKDPQFAERFNREGRVLARLNHPNIVSVFDFGRTEHFYFLLMEYVDGVNMRQAMRAGKFSPTEALTIIPKICEALQYAHEQGVLHRDIKPENILLDSRGRVKIADFGIAKLVGEDAAHVTLTNTGSALGTPHYMAPEQFEQPGTVDHRADIYSLGVVFYEMLTGELPLGRFDPPSIKSMVDARIDEVVFRTLERKREKRYQSAGDVRTRLDDIRNTPLPVGSRGRAADAVDPSAPPGPHGTMRVRVGAEAPGSHKAMWGAILTGLSMLLLVGTAVLTMSTGGHLGFFEILIIGFPGAGCALVGFILGWMALTDIREGHRQAGGLPGAIYAALGWPLLLVAAIGLGICSVVFYQVARAPGVLRLALVVLLGILAAGVALLVWIIRATHRWASGGRRGSQRGFWRWALASWLVLVAGLGLFLAWRGGFPSSDDRPWFRALNDRPPRPPRPPRAPDSSRFGGTERGPISAPFEVPPGKVALFNLWQHEGTNRSSVASMKGFVIAPEGEPARGEVILRPEMTRENTGEPPRGSRVWSMHLRNQNGAGVTLGSEELPAFLRFPGHAMFLFQPSNPFVEFPLTGGPMTRPLSLSLRVDYVDYDGELPAMERALTGVGTNWMSAWRMMETATAVDGQSALANADRMNVTATRVEIKETQDARWLAIDFVRQQRRNGDWELGFRSEAEKFILTTRTSGLLAAKEGWPEIRSERVEWRLPDGLSKKEALALSEKLSPSLVAKPVEVRLESATPWFEASLGEFGALRISLEAQPAARGHPGFGRRPPIPKP